MSLKEFVAQAEKDIYARFGLLVTVTLDTPKFDVLYGMIDIDDIIVTVCDKCNIKIEELLSKSREHPIPDIRKIVSLIAYDHCKHKYKDIGRALGGLKHCTVLVQRRIGYELLQTDKEFRDLYEACVIAVKEKL